MPRNVITKIIVLAKGAECPGTSAAIAVRNGLIVARLRPVAGAVAGIPRERSGRESKRAENRSNSNDLLHSSTPHVTMMICPRGVDGTNLTCSQSSEGDAYLSC